MSDWSVPISRMQGAMKLANETKLGELPSSSYSVEKPNSAEQAYFVNMIGTLLQLGNTTAQANMNKIVSNVRFMAFALAWFGLVCLCSFNHSVFMLLTLFAFLCAGRNRFP